MIFTQVVSLIYFFLSCYRSREGTNLEYLKNVVLSYLTTDSTSGRKEDAECHLHNPPVQPKRGQFVFFFEH